jgi:hypothetical protein
MIKVDIKSQTDKYLEMDGVLFFMGYHAPFFFLTLTSDSTSVAYVLLSDNPSSPVSHPQLDSAPTAPLPFMSADDYFSNNPDNPNSLSLSHLHRALSPTPSSLTPLAKSEPSTKIRLPDRSRPHTQPTGCQEESP